MAMTEGYKKRSIQISRREFLQMGALGTVGAIAAKHIDAAENIQPTGRPNFVFIFTDQQTMDTISAFGCKNVNTPNLDELVRGGMSFTQSYCANPLCSPSRSTLMTGRMPSETGVIHNSMGIQQGIPNIGQWLGARGYDTFYAGKWHLPYSFTEIKGFKTIPVGLGSQGTLGDKAVSRACQAFLRQRTSDDPFLLVCSFLQPHDICGVRAMHAGDKELPLPELVDEFSALPKNFGFDVAEPKAFKNIRESRGVYGKWSDEQWQYYRWIYYRMIEEVDAEIGRVSRAVQESGLEDNTIIIFSSDHGDGAAAHQMVGKLFPYEEAVRVPFIVSWPGKIAKNKVDSKSLVCGADLVPTLCDYAKVESPPKSRGMSLRPLLEGKNVKWRDFVVGEVGANKGRYVRTERYKYVTYKDDPVRQLFDIKADPGEMCNLATSAKYSDVLDEHQEILDGWEMQLSPAV
jgi:choline-sulfatase